MRLRWLIVVGLGAVVIVLALLVFSGGINKAVCPASGYAYTGDVELAFPREPSSVAACLGEGCTAASVAKSPDGRWLVPQSKPYLVPPDNATLIHVEVVDSLGARLSRVLPIDTEPTGEHPDGPGCGGPFRFKPVNVILEDRAGNQPGDGRPSGFKSWVR